MRKKIVKIIIKALISLIFLSWIIFKVQWADVFNLVKNIQPIYIVLYFLFLTVGVAISTYKWKLLAQSKDSQLTFFQFFKLYITGMFINNFMPSFIGGDTYRIYQSGKMDRKYASSALVVIMDRLTGLFGAMLLVFIFSVANFSVVMEQDILWMLNVIIAIIIFLGLICIMTRNASFWRDIERRFSAEKTVAKKIINIVKSILSFTSDAGVMRSAMLWSMVFGMIGVAGSNYILFLSVGERVAILDYLSVIFLISFVSSLPISINNIGVKEWAYVTFFGFLGVSSAVVITVAILSRLLQMIFSFLAWPFYLRNK
jgi:uncharacterized protein (TIRG00374 family)